MKHDKAEDRNVEIVLDGKRYVFDEPNLNVAFNRDSHGTYVSFNLGGTLNLKEVRSKASVCDCANCGFRGMAMCEHRKLMEEIGALRRKAARKPGKGRA